MKVRIHPDARSFLDRAGPWLSASEALYNEIYANARVLLTGTHPFREPLFFATVEDGGEVRGCALNPPPDYLSLTEMPHAAIAPLADAAAARCAMLHGIMGPETEARAFAAAWAERRPVVWRQRFRWRWYMARSVSVPALAAPGTLRLATLGDLPLAQRWGAAFADETGATVDVPAFFERRIRSDSLYLWEDGGKPRCVVAVSGKTPNGVRISGVFTPPEDRRRGYASAAVAAVTQHMLDSGWRFCVLVSDLATPTPNSIYQRIGYRRTGDIVIIDLEPR